MKTLFLLVALCAAGSHSKLVKSFATKNLNLQDVNLKDDDLPVIDPRDAGETTLDQENSTPDDVTTTDEEPVIIEPRENIRTQPIFDEESLQVIEDDMIGKMPSKFVRNFDETFDRQQSYKQVNCNGPTLSLAGTSVNNFLVVQSPFFPGTYPLFLWCNYNMDVPANSQVIVKVLAMDVQCPWDYVQFGVVGQAPIMRLCPLDKVGKTYTMLPKPEGYTFQITFMSDMFVAYSGFQMLIYLNATTPITTTTVSSVSSVSTTTLDPNLCTCGRFGQRDADDDRIVGGFVAAPNAYPYQIGLMRLTTTQPFCGGTLISPKYAITAAHCTASYLTNNVLRISLGDINYQVSGEGEQYINVARIIPHPNYNSTSQSNDFSLLELATPAVLSNRAGIACLPPDVSQTFAGVSMTISGWGTTASAGAQSPALKGALVTGWSNVDCRATKYKTMIQDNMICASAPGTDACQGDSGGPMVADVNGRVTLVGVVSFGVGCANPDYPGVYSRVTSQKDWILANSDAGKCQN